MSWRRLERRHRRAVASEQCATIAAESGAGWLDARQVVGAVAGDAGVDTFAAERCEVMLQELHQIGLTTRAQCLAHLGRHFRQTIEAPESMPDMAVGEKLLAEYIFVHLAPHCHHEKFALLVFMTRKLYALARHRPPTAWPRSTTPHSWRFCLPVPGLGVAGRAPRLQQCRLHSRGAAQAQARMEAYSQAQGTEMRAAGRR